jgi:hypothetical protein
MSKLDKNTFAYLIEIVRTDNNPQAFEKKAWKIFDIMYAIKYIIVDAICIPCMCNISKH